MEYSENVLFALGLSALAGLSTSLGSVIAYFIKKPRIAYLAIALGFASGVMIYISFMELLKTAMESVGTGRSLTFFFGGIALSGLIDLLIPEKENPDHFEKIEEGNGVGPQPHLMRMGLFTAFAVGLHNLPEGLATFGSALSDTRLGIYIAVAIAIHNIPEGISVSMPIFYATGSRKKAFFWSAISGLTEPLGALLGYALLMPFMSEILIQSMLAAIAGIMIYISVDELIPMAHRYGRSHHVVGGFAVGMLIMALSLALL